MVRCPAQGIGARIAPCSNHVPARIRATQGKGEWAAAPYIGDRSGRSRTKDARRLFAVGDDATTRCLPAHPGRGPAVSAPLIAAAYPAESHYPTYPT